MSCSVGIRGAVGKQRENNLPDNSLFRIAKLLVDVPVELYDELISRARRIWMEYWGASRVSGSANRCNFSKARKATGKNTTTETEFIRKRRLDVQATIKNKAGITRSRVLVEATAASSSQWGPAQQRKEDQFKALHRKSKVEASIGDNVLIDSEHTPDIIAAAGPAKKNRLKNDHSHDLVAARVKAGLKQRKEVPDMHKMNVWFSGGLTDLDACRTCVTELSCIRENDRRHEAILFVVADVASPGYHTSVTSALCGGMVVASTYFKSCGKSGTGALYSPSRATKRMLFLTPSFRTAQQAITATITACITAAGSNVRVVSAVELADFRKHDLEKAARSRRPLDAIAVGLTIEKAKPEFIDANWFFDLDAFINVIRKPSYTSKGISNF